MRKSMTMLGILVGVLSVAGSAHASVVRVPEPGSLTLLAVGGGVAGAIALGRRWRQRRETRRRRDAR